MELLKYVLLVTIIFDASIAFWVLYSGKTKKSLARLYFAFSITLVTWESTMWIAFYAGIQGRIFGFIIEAASYGLGPIIIFLLLLFCWELIQQKVIRKKIIRAVSVLSIIVSLISFVPGMVTSNNKIVSDINTTYNYTYIPGPVNQVYYFYYLIPSFLILYIFIKHLKNSKGVDKIRTQFIFYGIIGTLISGTITNIWVPLLAKWTLGYEAYTGSLFAINQVIGVILTSILSITTAYGITRYRFMDIKVVLKKSIVYGAALLCSVGLYVYVLWFIYKGVPSIITWIAGLLMYTLTWNAYSRKIKHLLDHIFLMNELDLSKRLDERLKALNSTFELEKYVTELTRSIEDAVDANVLSIFIAEREHNHFRSYYPKERYGSISFDNEILKLLYRAPNILVKDELECWKSDDTLQIFRALKKYNTSVILVIKQSNDTPLGVVFLGMKKNGSPYLSNEIKKLEYIIVNAQKQLPIVIQYHEALEGMKKTMHESTYNAKSY